MARLELYCLCAAWCGICRDYGPLFASLAARLPNVSLQWVDIEDEAQRIGDVDVETFPTLLIAEGGVPRFFGPVLPTEGALLQLLERAPAWQVDDPETLALLRRLAA